MRSNRHSWSIACILILSTLARAAGAEELELPKAREHLERGMRFYEAQAYDRAIAEFKAGYTLEPHRHFLYALGQAERMSGNCKRAIDAYNAFLRAGPPDEEADRANQNIERCEASLDEAPPPVAPAAPPAEPAKSSETADDLGPSTLTYVAFAVGGVGIVTGTVTGFLALSREDSARDQCSGATCPASAQGDIDATRRLAWISNVAFGVGIVGVALGFVGLVTSSSSQQPPAAVRANVTATRDGFATTLEGHF